MKQILLMVCLFAVTLLPQGCVTEGPGEDCFTVTYDLNAPAGELTGTAPVDNNRYLPGRTVTVLGTDATRTDHTFTGWNTKADGTGTAYRPDQTFEITSDVILYAQWSTVLYTVSYNANGGSGQFSEEVPAGNYTIREHLAIGISREGYLFTGWNTRADGQGDAYQPAATYVVTQDVVFYAQWELVNTIIHITYDANGGTGAFEEDVNPGDYWVRSQAETGIEHPQYHFVNWNTEPDGSGSTYSADRGYVVTSDLVLYAQWRRSVVVYEPNGGVGPTEREPWVDGYIVKSDADWGYSRFGHIFLGWNTRANGTGTDYTAGDEVNDPHGVFILYAQWQPSMIAYDPNGGTGSVESERWGNGYVVRLDDYWGFTRDRFTFTSWNAEPDGSGTFYYGYEVLPDPHGTFTLYAQWRPVLYEITYYANGGIGNRRQEQMTLDAAFNYYVRGNDYTNFTRTNYKFVGWNTQADGNGTDYAAADPIHWPTGDVELFAKWEPSSGG